MKTEFSQPKIYDVAPEHGEKLRTVFYSPNSLSVFCWICQRNGVKKYRQSRLWSLYEFLQYGDYIGPDKASLKLIRTELFGEYHLLSDSVIEDDLRLLARLGLIVESQTSEPPNIDACKEHHKEAMSYWKELAAKKK